MSQVSDSESYKVWAVDNKVYGPITLETLIAWIQDERVIPATLVFISSLNEWLPARSVTALQPALAALPSAADSTTPAEDVDPSELRQFEIFTGLTDRQMAQLVHFCEIKACQPEELLMRKGDPGDATYFVLSGSVRARLVIGLEDKTLGQIGSGEFFGEMAMFNESPRSADIVCEAGTRLMKLSAEAFRLLTRELPAIACPILYGMAKSMASRIAEDNLRLRRDVASSFVWR